MSSESSGSTRRERVLVVGGGGREHALCYALARSPQLERGFWIPGNGATIEKFEKHARPRATRIITKGTDCAFCRAKQISLVIIGPEAFLATGLADRTPRRGLAVLGPSAAAARLESDKHFAKTIMARAQVSTGRATLVSELGELEKALSTASLPIVVKACGLAEGKGVTICHTLDEAYRASHRILKDQVFGDSALLLEEFLSGEEFSFFACAPGGRRFLWGVLETISAPSIMTKDRTLEAWAEPRPRPLALLRLGTLRLGLLLHLAILLAPDWRSTLALEATLKRNSPSL